MRLPVAVLGIYLLLLGGACASRQCGVVRGSMGAAQVIDTQELMRFLFDPLYVDLRNAIAETPKGKKDWRKLYVAAYSLAEVNNLLFSRDQVANASPEDWTALSVAARDAAAALGEAVKKLDYNAARARYRTVVQSCNDCHQRFESEDAPVVEAFIGEMESSQAPIF